MELEISYNSFLIRKITKKTTEKISLKENSKIADLIDCLVIKYGKKFFELLLDNSSGEFKMLILINGLKAIGLEASLSNNDRINILSFTTGG
jgi:molybdopterin converting factor small subunit